MAHDPTRSRKKLISLCAGLLLPALMLALGSASSSAQDIHIWRFTGEITKSDSAIIPLVSPGAPFEATYRIDYNLFSQLIVGSYPAPSFVSAEFHAGGYSATFSGAGGIRVEDNLPFPSGGSLDFLILTVWNNYFFPSVHVGGAENGVSLIANVPRTGGGPFPALIDPRALDLNQFDQRFFTTYPTVDGVRFMTQGTVEQFYIDGALISQVPEPGVDALLVGGAVFIAARARISRRTHFRTSSCSPYGIRKTNASPT